VVLAKIASHAADATDVAHAVYSGALAVLVGRVALVQEHVLGLAVAGTR
jgi:hypothetical protein